MKGARFAGCILFVIDVAGLFGAFSLAHFFRIQRWYDIQAGELWLLVLASASCLYLMDAYNIRVSRTTNRFLADSFVAIIGAIITSVFITYLAGADYFTSLFGRGVLPVAALLFALWSIIFRWIVSEWVHKASGIEDWLIVSDESVYSNFLEDLALLPASVKTTRIDTHSTVEQIQDWKINNPSQAAVVFQDGIQHNPILVEQLRKIGKSGVYIFSLPDYYEQYWEKIPVTSVDLSWAFRSIGSNFLNDRIGIRLKRIADFIFGIAGLVVTSPILLATALIIRLTSSGDVIYRQTRVGLNEKNFTVYKFRSMANDAEKDGPQWSSVDDTRITGFGRLLRRSRIDELPQLWNLIIGNMSLIGPRPERPEFVENLKNEIPFYEMRALVTPGLTGWAQVNYPYGSSVDDARKKLEYDLFYIKNHSIRLDFSIVFRTFLVVLSGGGR